MVNAYLTMQYPQELNVLRDWLATHFAPQTDDAEGSALGLAQAVHSAIRYRRRMEKALELLSNSLLDALVTDEIAFDDAPAALPRILAPGAAGLAPVIRY